MRAQKTLLSLGKVLVLLPLAAAAGEPVRPLCRIEPTPEFPRRSEGDILALRDGSLLLAYTRFRGGTADDSTADIVARTSHDGGRTWSDDRLLVARGDARNVMSVSLLRLKNGDPLLFYLRKTDGWRECHLHVRRTTDEFRTLSEPVRVTVVDGYHVVNNDRVIQLSSGRLVVPSALHPCPDGTPKTWSPKAIPMAFLSDDHGRTWRSGRPVPASLDKEAVTLQEPGVIELKDGRVWMWMRTDRNRQYEAFSRDGGETWSDPRPGPLVSAAFSPASIARNPATGDLVCVWNEGSPAATSAPSRKRTPLCVAVSRNDGRTWTKSRPIETDPDGWYCYTSITFLADDMLLSYCAGDRQTGGLNRLKVLAVPLEWLAATNEP